MNRHALKFWCCFGILLSLMVICGCVDGDDDTSGKVRVLHPTSANDQEVARTVTINPEAKEFIFTGMNAAGDVLYGPQSMSYADSHLLTDVPLDVTSLHIEYRTADNSLHAWADADLNVVEDETVTVSASISKNLTVLLLNESDVDDKDVYILLSANGNVDVDTHIKTDKPQGTLAVYEIGRGSGDVQSSRLTDLQVISQRTSPLTGKTNNVYGFRPTDVDSGRLWVSYNEPLTYKAGDTSPTSLENVRYDKMELGYTMGKNNDVGYFDLTSVDFFGIPMQLEVMAHQEDLSPFHTTTFYTSTATLLKKLYQLDPANMDQAFYEQSATSASPGWIPGSDSLRTFLRIMSPLTLSAMLPANATAPFSAAPYPSYHNYLTTLVNNGVAVTFKGANGVDNGPLTHWAYQASISSDDKGGFIVTCKPTAPMSNAPQGSIGDSNYPDNPPLPKDLTVRLGLDSRYFDQFVYGVPANSFSVQDLDCYLVPYAANSVYANIAGNFLAALNFGYVGSRYGSNGTSWFEDLPGYAPYGAARTTDEGYYNPYAAILYNLSDSYSFSISDRLQVGNPLVTTSPDNPYLRITILPDDRLDAPQNIRVTSLSNATMQVEWEPVTENPASGYSLTGYKVIAEDDSVPVAKPTEQPPIKILPNQVVVNTNSTAAAAILTDLTPGTMYQISVVAVGQSPGGKAVQSTQSMIATAATTYASTIPADSAINYELSVSPGSGMPPDTTFLVDAKEVPQNTNIQIGKQKPSVNGTLIKSLLTIQGPNQDIAQRATTPTVTYAQTNILFNAFDMGNQTFNVYFNFPFSSTVPLSGSDKTTLSDGSSLGFSYSSSFGITGTQPPFGDTANSLVVNVIPSPTNAPKTYSEVTFPDSAQVPLDPNPQPPLDPAYQPPAHQPTICPTFKVLAVLGQGSPVTDLADLKGATVKAQRLATIPANVHSIPADDGSGADAAGTLNKEGYVIFDPSMTPYTAPIWNLGYRITITYNGVDYPAYGAWRTPEVGSKWQSGLTTQPDTPGVIYVPIYPDALDDQTLWGN